MSVRPGYESFITEGAVQQRTSVRFNKIFLFVVKIDDPGRRGSLIPSPRKNLKSRGKTCVVESYFFFFASSFSCNDMSKSLASRLSFLLVNLPLRAHKQIPAS